MSKDSIQAGHASALSRRAGLSPDQRPQWSDGRREVFIHPTSVNHMVSEYRQPFLVFHEKVSAQLSLVLQYLGYIWATLKFKSLVNHFGYTQVQ